MPRIESIAQLEELRRNLQEGASRTAVSVCQGPCCQTKGSAALQEAMQAKGVPGVDAAGCQGLCSQGVMVAVQPQGVLYQGVQPGDIDAIMASLTSGTPVEHLLLTDPASGAVVSRKDEHPFYRPQETVLLQNLAAGGAETLTGYLKLGGYQALAKALGQMTPEAVAAAVEASGLRGRGGAAFPTGVKWRFCRSVAAEARYVIANGDEGDPGSFVDRAFMEGDPLALLEGMTLAGFAIGAARGFIYLRHEYPRAAASLTTALQQAREAGLLGENILGSGYSFDIKLVRGAGSYVCGEETALIASVEGDIGEPRVRPPFPAQQGLWGMPTVVNNIETLVNVPGIITGGPEAYKARGTAQSSGTKVFCLVGAVRNAGLVEMPFGVTLRELIYDIGGGLLGHHTLKAVQSGGPMGSFIPAQFADLPCAYEAFQEKGFILGHGSLIVLDNTSCMVDATRQLVEFLHRESCGKCTPCREGTRHLLWMLNEIAAGRGQADFLPLMEELGQTMAAASFCGLGQGAPNPVSSAITYFREEFETHIHDKICPAGVCRALA